MPAKVKVKIIAGRNLPVMDKSNDTTDAYVEMKLGGTTYKTDVCRKSLHPQWNSEWYRFEVDDSELQDEPLQLRLMDHDTYSSNDAIGKVYLDLNPLLIPTASGKYSWNGDNNTNHEHPSNAVMSGWIPVYDTMHGIRGEVNIIVKVELFSDFNRFRQSSCGIQFFSSKSVPSGYFAQTVHGFVEELVVNDDPEYKWIDKIRTPRASNEARQTLFIKLSGELQRKIGVKALDLGGNAVIGYCHNFDLEGESGIVARGIGTAVTLVRMIDVPHANTVDCFNEEDTSSSVPVTQPSHHHPEPGHQRTESVGAKILSPAKLNNVSCIHRRSSDSDLSITPKGNSLTGSDRSTANANAHLMRSNILFRTNVPQENFEMLEYPFLTMTRYPPGFIQHLGGAVSARSVKLLERISNFEEPESRDTWWSEIRMEIRSHARALNCNAVLGYSETTAICEDVCVLSASGTAAVIGFQYTGEMGDSVSGLSVMPKPHNPVILERSDATGKDRNQKNVESKHPKASGESPVHDVFGADTFRACSICHMPYNTNNVPIRATTLKCGQCRSAKVPDVIIATIEPPDGIPTIGRGCFIQSFVHRQLKDTKSESNANEISDGLPFLEYELHRLLINKLKIKGMNAIFGLNIKISVGEKVLVALATGTAVFLTPLPSPVLPKLVSDRSSDEKRLADLQKLLSETVKRNRETYQLKQMDDCPNGRVMSDDESDDEQTSIDLSLGSKDCCVLQVDDPEDAEVLNLLMEERPPDGFHVVSTEQVPGLEDMEIVKTIQMFTQIYRTKFQQTGNFYKQFHRLLKTVFFKLRRIVPCALCDLEFYVELPEPDEIQLFVLGTVLGLGDPHKTKLKRKNTATKKNEDDLIFNLEEDQIPENSVVTQNYLTAQQARHRQKSPLRNKLSSIVKPRNVSSTERDFVDLTSLSYIPGGKIEHYLGHLNFFFIRETTSIREEGGLSGFIHTFMTEVLAIVRAHVTALGGNAMVAYFMTECVLNYNLHKNQGQCLINVGGDVVFISYFVEDP